MLGLQFKKKWTVFWMRFAGLSHMGRLAMRLAGWTHPPYKARHELAKMSKIGYISPSVRIHLQNIELGKHVFLGDNVIIFGRGTSESLTINDDVYINKDTILELGKGGSITIGARTTIQPRCQFSAYIGQIKIGDDVQVAPNCAFYPYNHQMHPVKPMKVQPLVSKGGIYIENDVWLGYGVVVLDGVHIGKGAVIGAGSVVKGDIPAGSIAVGIPARVVKDRRDYGHP